MDEKAKQIYEEMNVKEMDGNTKWVINGTDDDDIRDSTSIGTVSENSMNSECSSAWELADEEALSSTPSSSSSNILNESSELMTHLPIKRGLSMFYKGKAQSFTSLAKVQSIQDLPKKMTPYRKKMKSCKSYGRGFDNSGHKKSFTPKAIISKKASRGSFISVLSKRTRPSIAVQNKF